MNEDEQERTTQQTFGWAIKQLQNGSKVTREGWDAQGMWICLQVPDENSKMTLPYVYLYTAGFDLVPWTASQTDQLATDWRLI